MLIINDNLYSSEQIVKGSTCKQWSTDESKLLTSCAIDSLKSLLLQSKTENKVIFILDLNNGGLPSVTYGIELAAKFLKMKDILSKKLDFTLIYSKDSQTKDWFDKVLQVYIPTRPLYFLESKTDVKNVLKYAKKHGINHEKDLLEQIN